MRVKPVFVGLLAGAALLVVYIGVLTLLNSFGHAVEQFEALWYLMVPLVAGFGVQVGLYAHVREAAAAGTAGVAASGGMSAGSMAACCAHHVTEVLPLIGLSAAAPFLVQYQQPLMLLGVLSNVMGIMMMLGVIKEHGLYGRKRGVLRALMGYDMANARNYALALSAIVLAVAFANAAFPAYVPSDGAAGGLLVAGLNAEVVGTGAAPDAAGAVQLGGGAEGAGLALPSKFNEGGGVSVEVKPLGFEFGKPVEFSVSLNTHSVELDFDMMAVSVLEDGAGNVYAPLAWEGSPPGGHHRSGTLKFPALRGNAGSMALKIMGVSGVPERGFEWELA